MESIGENIYIFKHFQNGVGEYRLIVYGWQNSKVDPRFLTLLVCTPCIKPSPWMGLVNIMKAFKRHLGISLVVQWLRLHASTAGDAGWIPGWEAKIPHAAHEAKRKKPARTVRGEWGTGWWQRGGSHQHWKALVQHKKTLPELATVSLSRFF